MGENQQRGTASGPWEFGPRVHSEESGMIPPLFPLPHALATLLSLDPRAQESRLDGARSGFRRLFSVDGSTAPSIQASSPATAQEPASLPPSSALGAPRLPQARAALAIGVALLTPIRLLFWTLHPQPAEPRPATPASDTRPPTNGPAAEEAAEGAPKPRDRSLCAQATRPSLPRPYRNRRELRDPSPLAVIRQIRKNFTSDFKAGKRKASPRFPWSPPGWARRERSPGGKRRPEPPPPQLARASRTRGSSARDSRAPPPRGALRPRRPRLPPGQGNWRESASRANTPVLPPTSHAPRVRGLPATLWGHR